ncbi:DUF5666 domain-containing protein [[Mycobacterium] vasticus]|uniref:DUF5666 domain-containing protein n=1 Tax=[Mycobacterium] vasticus TaxID=2875777 RepID=A0ABU5YWX1_9MYCO|nr:DUF5666 domain-containing protein [Mycolicibacter sp. MYC017]MEB3068479.1 DUF5666 domain-containing protein [Mycolicibacter sp. MYC017]
MTLSTTTPALRALTGAATLFAAALMVPALAHAQGDHVVGSVSSVSGNTFEVAGSAGTVTVSLADGTKVLESVPAQRGEITAGTCIKAGATPDSAPADSGAITAKFVAITATVDGKCPQRPADAPAAAHHRGVRGVVEWVSGDTVTVNGPSGQTAVTINDATHVRRMVAVSAPSISAGKCVAARGTTDGDGVLQASRVTVWNGDGGCPTPPA